MNHESPQRNCKSTPPTNRKVRNPFDKGLIERLHNPICSPGMCKIYKKKSHGSFRWEIDQACTLHPAEIVACNSQFEPSPDPALEKIAEEATEKFFSQELIMPSPLMSSKKEKPLTRSSDTSIHYFSSVVKQSVVTKDVSAQTVLSLPPKLPPEVEKILQTFCTCTQEQNISGEYEITANGSLRRQLIFEEHSDMEHYDSEQTDDEAHADQRQLSNFETHTPVVVSPDLSRDLVAKGMKRTFGTPVSKGDSNGKPYRNKILDVVDFGEPCFSPIEFRTPQRQDTPKSSSLASISISPVTKVTSSDEEKNTFTSPESETIATCFDCIEAKADDQKQGPCFCNKKTPNKLLLKRSASLKESPPRSRKGSFSGKRSLSMSSLHRSRSVQKLDFSMDMSIDGSFQDHSHADSESSSPKNKTTSPEKSWMLTEGTSIHRIVKSSADVEISHAQESLILGNIIDETPIKGKSKRSVLSHEISKIRTSRIVSPMHMSLDNSVDHLDTSLEDKKIDFTNIDLKFLTENVSRFDYTNNATKASETGSLRKVDSGYNENTFYANASSYYESAIKPSELTVTNVSNNKTVLKEISNVPWVRSDSGFKDENSADSTQFYPNDSSIKKVNSFHLSEARLEEKENVVTSNFDRYFMQNATKSETMSMSDIFTDDMTFNCNFSSTPSKNKTRRVNL